MESLVTTLLVGYGICSALFALVWCVVGWLAQRREYALVHRRLNELHEEERR